jgi:hypothetical protein
VLTAVVAVVVLGGCGTPAPSADSTPQPLSFLPSADAYHSAIVATRALGTARITIDGTIPEAAGSSQVAATGVTVLGTGMGDLNWTTPAGDYRELVNNRGIYVTSNGTDWTQWMIEQPTATSAYVDPLRGLGVLQDVNRRGPQTLGNVPTTRYTGRLPLDAKRREDVSVWIDDFGHVIRVDRTVLDANGRQLGDISATMTDFGLQLDLSSPSGNVTLGATALPTDAAR